MTTQELKDLFVMYYDEAVASKDPAKMRILGGVTTRLFNKAAEMHPDIAQREIEALEAMNFRNYVTSAEASEIAAKFVNDDKAITGSSEPSKGAHWSMATAKDFLTSRNIPLDDKPYYNWYALWLTMNMIYSDFADEIVELIGEKNGEKIAVASYKMAVKKLKDLDRPHFLREYFELD